MPRPPRDENVVKPNPRLPRELYERLQRIAARERRSLNEQIVKALEDHADREEQKRK
jgi:predicted HicB family RNase H-like nuclease